MISKHGLVGKHWKNSGLEHLKQDCFKCFPKRKHSLVCLKPGYPDSNGWWSLSHSFLVQQTWSKLKALGLLDGIPRSIGWSEVSPWHWFFWSIIYIYIYGILTYTTVVYLSMFRPNPTMKVGDLISHEIPMICSHVSSVQTHQLRPSFTPCSPWGWDRYPVRKWIIK